MFACDYSELALKTHAHNHPDCQHACLTLPDDESKIVWPTGPFHLHGSPPCTRLTCMQMETDVEKKAEAVELVRWFLKTALERSPQRWSMEQVPAPLIRATLDELKRKSRHVDYVVVGFHDLGLPQTRRRLLAGPPHLIDRIRAYQSRDRWCSVGRAVTTMPPTAQYVRNSLVNSTAGGGTGPRLHIRKTLRRVTKPSFCLVTTIALRWYSARRKVIRSMSIPELCVVQGFPPTFSFPADVPKPAQLLGIANAVPPMVMSLMLGSRPTPHPPRAGERGACATACASDESEPGEPESPSTLPTCRRKYYAIMRQIMAEPIESVESD